MKKCKECSKFEKTVEDIYGHIYGRCPHSWFLVDGELKACSKADFSYMEKWENRPIEFYGD